MINHQQTAENIRQARLNQNYTQEYVADETKISQGHLSEIENNKTSPTLIEIDEIAKATHTEGEKLISSTTPTQQNNVTNNTQPTNFQFINLTINTNSDIDKENIIQQMKKIFENLSGIQSGEKK